MGRSVKRHSLSVFLGIPRGVVSFKLVKVPTIRLAASRVPHVVLMVKLDGKWIKSVPLFDDAEPKAERLKVDELKTLIVEALPFMRARHAWKPTAPHADMIRALEEAVAEKRKKQ